MSISELYHIRRAVRRGLKEENEEEDDEAEAAAPPLVAPRGRVRLCGICFEKEAAYTCPSCHAPYCTLVCYRAASHACGGAFAAKAARQLSDEDVRVDEEERRRTMEILWRLESGEGVREEEGDDDGDDGDGGAVDVDVDVAVDVDTASVDDLLRMLTVEERNRFAALLRQPDQAERLLERAGLWWDGEDLPPYTALGALAPARTPVDLRFHVLYVLMAYTYTLQRYGVDRLARVHRDERAQCTRDLVDLIPFFSARHSRMALASVQEACVCFLQVLGLEGAEPLELLLSLLASVERLLRPVQDADEPLFAYPLRALADVHAVLPKPLAKKVEFYAASLYVRGPADVSTLREPIRVYVGRLEREQDERVRAEHLASAHQAMSRMDASIQALHKPPRIQVVAPKRT